MTEEYTRIQLTRQDELTRRIQERLISVGERTAAEAIDEGGASAVPEVPILTCSSEAVRADASGSSGRLRLEGVAMMQRTVVDVSP